MYASARALLSSFRPVKSSGDSNRQFKESLKDYCAAPATGNKQLKMLKLGFSRQMVAEDSAEAR